jgi:hypothetical protein
VLDPPLSAGMRAVLAHAVAVTGRGPPRRHARQGHRETDLPPQSERIALIPEASRGGEGRIHSNSGAEFPETRPTAGEEAAADTPHESAAEEPLDQAAYEDAPSTASTSHRPHPEPEPPAAPIEADLDSAWDEPALAPGSSPLDAALRDLLRNWEDLDPRHQQFTESPEDDVEASPDPYATRDEDGHEGTTRRGAEGGRP